MKRIFALFLAVLLLCSMVACNSTHQPRPITAERSSVDHVWKSEYYRLPDQVTGTLDTYTFDGTNFRFSGQRKISDNPQKEEAVSVTFDMEERTFTVTPESTEQDSENQQIQHHLPYGTDGSLKVLLTANETADSEAYVLRHVASDNTVLWEIDIRSLFQNITENRSHFFIDEIQYDEITQTIYLRSLHTIVAVSSDGMRLYEIAADMSLDNIFTSADGHVYGAFIKRNPMSGDIKTTLQRIDDSKQDFADAITLPKTIQLQNADVHFAPGYDLFYSNDIGLYGWNTTDAEPTLLCSWVNSDLTQYEARPLIVLSSTLAVRAERDPVTRAPRLCVMTPIPPEEVVPKYLINVAYVENMADMQPFAVAFNRESEDYRVVLHDYSGYASPADVLALEIVAGEVPDVIVELGGAFHTDNLAEKGLFLDLYTLMDAPDSVMPRDAFLPCVLKPFENADGALPYLVSGFTLRTMFGSKTVFGDRQSWTLDELYEIQKSLSDGTYLFSASLQGKAENAPMILFNRLIPYTLSAFIDEEKNTCTFDDGRFAEFLRFCMTTPVFDTSVKGNTVENYRNGTLLLQQEEVLFLGNYLYTKYFTFDNNMTVIGYPTADNRTVSGTAAAPLQKFCITAESEVPDGAWEFILRTFGETDEGFYLNPVTGFPSLRAALNRMLDDESKLHYLFNEGSISNSTYGPEEDPWIKDAIASGAVYAQLTEDDRSELLSLLENITLAANTNDDVIALIREDASAYFAGAKSLDETVKIIQSRVSIYVSEHS